MSRGYFAVGIYMPRTEENVGTLLRTANLYGAAFVFTIGRKYHPQSTDTMSTHKHVPLFHFDTLDAARSALPDGCALVGIELNKRSRMLTDFKHPERVAYLLGSEREGLSREVMDECDALVQIDCPKPWSMNVAVAGSVVVYDRHAKGIGS